MAFRWPAKAIVLASVAAGAAFVAAQEPDIRVNVSLVHVIATVRDKAGALIGTMHRDDFEILDNGAKQEVAVFSRQTDQPLSVALLVDVSGSTAKELKYEIDSAARFLHALLTEGNPEDRAALYAFSYDIQQGEFTHNYASLERQVRLLHGDTGTSLYDAIYFAGQALERREGRKAMIVVTDGGDTTSSRDLKAALKQAQMADAVIFPIVVLPIINDAGRNTGGEHALEFMAQGTGGRTFYPEGPVQLDKAFTDVVMELRTQYLLAFYPKGVPLNKNPFHSLEVRVKPPGLRVSARNGYYGESDGGGSPSTRISVTPERTTKKR